MPLTCTLGVTADVHVQAEQQANCEFCILLVFLVIESWTDSNLP